MFSFVPTMARELSVGSNLHTALALGLMLAGGSLANAASPSGKTSWAARPNGEDVARAYPKDAARRGEPGQAVIACRADAKGRLSPCIPLAMANASFAVGALKLGPIFRLRPTTSTGDSVEGLVVVIPIQFTIDGSRSPDLVFAFGSPAFLLSPGEGVDSIACGTAEGPRSCTAHPFAWREDVPLAESAAVAAPLAERPDSTLDCKVGGEGGLKDCVLTGEFTDPERARLMALIAKLRAPERTHDGRPIAGGRIVVPMIWRALSQVAVTYLKFDPAAADPP